MSLNDVLSKLQPGTDWSAACTELEALGLASPAALAFYDSRLKGRHHEAQQLVLDHLATSPVSINAQLRSEQQARDAAISTGIEALDELLGHLHPGEVVELSGAKGSGKTHLALLTVLNHLRTHEQATAVWISTEGQLNPEWALNVLRTLDTTEDVKPTTPEASQALEDRLLTVLDRLALVQARTADEVVKQLGSIRTNAIEQRKKLDIVVIDSVTSLFSLNGESAQGHATMISTMRHLGFLARSADLPFLLLVVNSSVSALPAAQLASFSDTRQKPALGSSFPFVVDLTLWCSGSERFPKPTATTAKRNGRTGSVRTVEIWRSRGDRVLRMPWQPR